MMRPILPAGIALETKARRPIRNYQRLDQTPIHLRAAIDFILGAHLTARLRSATGEYNCFGMVFASRRTCIDALEGEDIEEDIRHILRDDGYRQLRQDEIPETGDIVLYGGEDGALSHAAIVTAVTPTVDPQILVTSQWGADGEYTHRAEDVENVLGRPNEYWTDRRPPP